MRSLVVVSQLFLLVGILTVTGCADNSADGLVKQQVAEMNKLADGLEAGQTEADMSYDRLEGITKKLEALNLSEEDKQALLKRHEKAVQEATGRLMQASMKGASGG